MALKYFLAIIVLIFSAKTRAQNAQHTPLINSPELQYEITEAMDLLYNFKFEKADSIFKTYKTRFSNHPLPYFLLGYSQYWRTQPNEDSQVYDPAFYAYMDTVVDLSDKMYDKNDKDFEAIFFLTAAHAFNGRRRSDNKEWTRATFSGSKALHYLKLSREYNDLSPEFLMGEGLFNYFSEWIPENYKGLRPVMWFFPKGDKATGIKLLKQACDNAFYTRVESQHFLVRILLLEERKDTAAYPYAKLLHSNYPENPVFERLYARVLFSMGRYSECMRISESILAKIEAGKTGYEEVSGRYATFFLGWINRYRNKELAKKYFRQNIEYSEKIGAVKMNYYLYSLEALAQYAEEEKDKTAQAIYLKKIKENANKDHELYKTSKKKLKAVEND